MKIDLKALRALCDAATDGEFVSDNHIPHAGEKVKVKVSLRSGRVDYVDFETETAANEFIWSIHRSENIKRAVIVK